MFTDDPADNDPIRKYQTDLRECSERAEQLRPILRSVQDAITRCQSTASPLVRNGKFGKPIIEIAMCADTLQDSVDLMRELAKEGIHSRDKKFADKNLFDVFAMRTYELGPDVCLTVMLTGKSCKMVQTGTKTVPVYDIQCGDTIDAAPPVPQIANQL